MSLSLNSDILRPYWYLMKLLDIHVQGILVTVHVQGILAIKVCTPSKPDLGDITQAMYSHHIMLLYFVGPLTCQSSLLYHKSSIRISLVHTGQWHHAAAENIFDFVFSALKALNIPKKSQQNIRI